MTEREQQDQPALSLHEHLRRMHGRPAVGRRVRNDPLAPPAPDDLLADGEQAGES